MAAAPPSETTVRALLKRLATLVDQARELEEQAVEML